jgi:LuxR family maltose regulon positive regulatory protein
MTIPLLQTKLFVPPPRPTVLSRPRLVRRLEAGLDPGQRLILVSAPAGYGKTTLLSEWVQALGGKAPPRAIAWLSLDEGDNDPVRFWTYLLAALQQVNPDLGRGLPDAFRSPQQPSIEALLTPLINQIAALADPLVLILDDYHLISTPQIHEGTEFLLDHLPGHGHLVIATRADPPLSLARLRGRGQLTEIRQSDLRFTAEEAAAFLYTVFGLDLPPHGLAALEARTEGWITGLQLAALSMEGRDNVAAFLSAFTGSHRYVLDYLTAEVIRRQPDDVQTFLHQTSILDRLSGPLCDAVIGISGKASQREGNAAPFHTFDDSQALLERLETANLFVVPLDDRRVWYRYHRLFADLLRARLMELTPERVPELHRRASVWYEEANLLDDAIRHAVAAGDLTRAVRIVETHGRSLLLRGELTTVLRWIGSLPEEEIERSAPICVIHAWALLLTGQPASVEPRLERVEEIVPSNSPSLGDVAAIRTYLAAQQGDVSRTIALAETALERLPPSKLGERAVVFFALGGARLLQGNMGGAVEALRKAAAVGQEGGNVHLAVSALSSLADIQLSRGQLQDAEATAREAVVLVTGPDEHPLPIAAGAVSALAELAYEWNRLDEAVAYAREGVALARLWGNADPLSFAYLTLADVLIGAGRFDEARDALRDAEHLSRDVTLSPSFLPAWRATWVRLSLRKGNLMEAEEWAKRLAPESTVTMDMRGPHILAQVDLALGKPDAALDTVSTLLEVARAQRLTAWLVKGLTLQALIYHIQGRKTRALTALVKALTLAEPERYVRTFVDLGPAMAPLLQEAAAQGVTPDYVGDLLSALAGVEGVSLPTEAQPLIEPLSDRELEVLALVAEGLSNRDVGRRLHIAESTVKSHLNHVYGKLAVDNRIQAVAKAHALNLLE